MRKYIFLLASVMLLTITFVACVDEDGPGVPQPKSMLLENDEYNIDFTNDTVDYVSLCWVDVQNATYKVTLSNSENDVVTELTNETSSLDNNVLDMTVPYTQLSEYLKAAGLDTKTECDVTVSVTGTPIDSSKKTALDAEGSTVKATIHIIQ